MLLIHFEVDTVTCSIAREAAARIRLLCSLHGFDRVNSLHTALEYHRGICM